MFIRIFGLLQSELIAAGTLHVFPPSVERTISTLVQNKAEACVYVKNIRCGFAGSTASDGLSASSVLPSSETACCGSLHVFPPFAENDTDGPMSGVKPSDAMVFKIDAY